jgi:hypothetical protein
LAVKAGERAGSQGTSRDGPRVGCTTS